MSNPFILKGRQVGSTIYQQKAQELAANVIRRKDELIKDAITHVMGPEWENDTEAALKRVTVGGHMPETIYIDDVAMIQFYGMKIGPEVCGVAHSITATLQYVELYK